MHIKQENSVPSKIDHIVWTIYIVLKYKTN